MTKYLYRCIACSSEEEYDFSMTGTLPAPLYLPQESAGDSLDPVHMTPKDDEGYVRFCAGRMKKVYAQRGINYGYSRDGKDKYAFAHLKKE